MHRDMNIRLLSASCFATALLLGAAASRTPEDSTAAVRAVMTAQESLRAVPLRDIISAATGFEVRTFSPASDATDALCQAHITTAAGDLLQWLNADGSPLRKLRRINEASRYAEDRLVQSLNTGDFTCSFPTTRAGAAQRSGYPDLRIEHRPTKRVWFLDPKLYEATSRSSSLRTFYYEPRDLTGKIKENAAHLILGLAHDGKDGAWTFTGWDLVDLHDFQVTLKAEFQAGNKELYREELIRASSHPGK